MYFCSDEALRSQDVNDMYKTDEKWGDDEDLLGGYRHEFLHNRSLSPSFLKWPFGLVNLSIWDGIKKTRPDIVVIMSWMNVTWWVAIAACIRYNIPFFYMTDANMQKELWEPSWKRWVKNLVLGRFIFRLAEGFLCSGTANRELFQFYGVPEHKLIPFAYSWGYESHIEASKELHPRRKELMEAYRRLGSEKTFLHIVGDGVQMDVLQGFIKQHELSSVRVSGFQNRKEISKYFTTADLLVLPSNREGWGIVVNEALCYGLPVIASDQVGAAVDLVNEGENGFVFPNGDIQSLAERLRHILELSDNQRKSMGEKSRDRITRWIDRDLVKSLDQYFDIV